MELQQTILPITYMELPMQCSSLGNILPSPSIFLLFILSFIPFVTAADLNSDQQALLNFASSVPHKRTLNWDSNNSMCSGWIGVTCNAGGRHVIALRLPAIGLLGVIPPNSLGKLDYLQVLSLRSNLLGGSLPTDVSSLPSLRYVFLQNNNISGSLPIFLSYHLSILDLSFNSFSGVIPSNIKYLFQLTRLYLQNNSLTGHIPDFKFQKLKHLNFSYNNLSGSIPLSLQTFSNSSFLGNPLLCGYPLVECSVLPPAASPQQLPSSLPRQKLRKTLSTGVIVTIAVGCLALLLLLAIILLLCLLRRKSKEGSGVSKRKVLGSGQGEKPKEEYGSSGAQEAERNKLVFFEGCSYSIDLEDLLRASAEILGKGTYGTSYKAVLEDGMTVVVKRLKEVVAGKREFELQMGIVGRLGKHPNVVPLRAYYFSKDEKLLVHDYSPAGNLASLLHGNRATQRHHLDWDSRVKISIGIARGLGHIHSGDGGKLMHGSIKASNVLITEDLDGCISDYGFATIMHFPVIPRNIVGYRAPEVIVTRKFTQKSDVYSFGVLLLEMLTGKAPSQSPSRDDVLDLPRWVQSVVREEWTAEVFDPELVSDQNVEEEELVHMLQIAMACVEKNPDLRPDMVEVIKMMEDLQQSDSNDGPLPEDNTKDSNIKLPLEGQS